MGVSAGRLAAALAALAALYLAIGLAGDARAASGSDAGGKIATVEAMVDGDTWRPDVGYWAASHDPDGRHHPMIYTERYGDRWVQVTSLPMIYAGVVLWRIAGPDGLLLLPILGSLAAAYGAGRLARAVGADSSWPSFWAVGLASTTVFYAADFWEHAIGVGLATVAVALIVERPGVAAALAAGGIGGLGTVMRTEVAVFLFALGLVTLAVAEERRWWLGRPLRIGAVAGGFAAVVVANRAVESWALDGASRASRLGTNVADAGSELADRSRDAMITTFGWLPQSGPEGWLPGVAVVAAAVGLVAWWRVGERAGLIGRASLVIVVGLVVARWARGVGFVPGVLAAVPLSALGLWLVPRWRRDAAARVGMAALVALPIVWTFQWRGQLVPQWGGRYVLIAAALLVAVGVARVPAAGWRQPPLVALAAASLAVTVLGAAWHVERTNLVGDTVDQITAVVPADAVVLSTLSHAGRELGIAYDERRWLWVGRDGDIVSAASVLRAAEIDDVYALTFSGPDFRLDGYRRAGATKISYLGVPVWLRHLERVR